MDGTSLKFIGVGLMAIGMSGLIIIRSNLT